MDRHRGVWDRLESVQAELQAQGLQAHLEVGSGDPGEAIVTFAARRECGMIAMSTHGRHGLGRWAMGSVTDWVIRHAHAPVLADRNYDRSRHFLSWMLAS
jgi:nucleotide-binding universal stress UspA family protein